MTTKRILGWLIALTALFAIGFTAVTYAQSNMPHAMMLNGIAPVINQSGNFIDEDGDGVCDNCANGQMGANFVDEDGDGVCDNCANGQMGQGQMHGQMMQMHQGQMGANFVDEDGDGVCDNCANGQMGQGQMHGQMMGQHQGQMGQHFIDEDGDGVCDNMPSATPTE